LFVKIIFINFLNLLYLLNNSTSTLWNYMLFNKYNKEWEPKARIFACFLVLDFRIKFYQMIAHDETLITKKFYVKHAIDFRNIVSKELSTTKKIWQHFITEFMIHFINEFL